MPTTDLSLMPRATTYHQYGYNVDTAHQLPRKEATKLRLQSAANTKSASKVWKHDIPSSHNEVKV